MMRLFLVIVLAYIGFHTLSVLHKKYVPEDFFPRAIDKVIEVGADTFDALSSVYEEHKLETEKE
jgi:hypothetical protein